MGRRAGKTLWAIPSPEIWKYEEIDDFWERNTLTKTYKKRYKQSEYFVTKIKYTTQNSLKAMKKKWKYYTHLSEDKLGDRVFMHTPGYSHKLLYKNWGKISFPGA